MSAQVDAALEAEAVRARAAEVIAGLKENPRGFEWPDWLKFPDWFDGFEPAAALARWLAENSAWLFGSAAVVGALTIALLIWRALARFEGARRSADPGAGDVSQAKVQQRFEDLCAAARAARERGDRRTALRMWFLAALVALSRRGDLEFREAWTNHELVDRGAHSAGLRERLAPIVDELDRLIYGGDAIEDAHLDRLERLCESVRP